MKIYQLHPVEVQMRILLVEDEPDLGTAIQKTLERERYIVDRVQDGCEAWNYLDQQWMHYKLAIVDWMLPGLSGLELCKKLRESKSALPVLMLTAKDQISDRVTGLDAGADDYLVKPFGMAELLARLRALQRRSLQLQSPQLQVGNLVLDYATSTVSISTSTGELQNIPLTAKEFQLLEYFMQHPNQILSRDQIILRIWRAEADFSSNVVAAQMRLLRRKLIKYGYDQLIETVYGMGYKFKIYET